MSWLWLWIFIDTVFATPTGMFHIKSKLWLTLILLTWKIRWAPNNAIKWHMGFNSAFKGLSLFKCAQPWISVSDNMYSPFFFASLPTFRLYKMISAIVRAQIMWRVLLNILHITRTCETSFFCHNGDEGFALLCCYAAHVASSLLMFKDSLSSRKKHAHIDKYIWKGVTHYCTTPGSLSVVETCSLVIEILVVTPVMQLSTIP